MHQKYLHRNRGALLTLLFAAAFILWKFWGMVTSLGSMKVMDPYRDGIKTYLNAVWHAQFSPSMTLFTGMNYPYPEHIVAATEMPGVALFLRLVEPVFPGISWHVFGIMHALLLLSILACAWFLFRILKMWEVPDWVAVPSALFITVLAPQNLRMPTHMGLAPLFVIPGLLYLVLCYVRNPRAKTALLIGGFIVLVSLLHFYFFAITLIALVLFLFFWSLRNVFFTNSGAIKPGRFIGHIVLMVGLPLLVFIPWLILNDPVPERNPEPWGFFYYHAGLETIFASPHLPFWKWLAENGIKFRDLDFEGWSYVGLVAGVFSVLFTLRFLLSAAVRRFRLTAVQPYAALWLMAIITLLLSMSFPFVLPGWEGLLDYFGPLKQFRSTGRFAWIFYFVANLMAVTLIYHWVKRWKKRPAGVAMMVLCLIVLGLEAWQFSNCGAYYHDYKLREIAELKDGQRFSDSDIDWSRYQAVVPLPYYNVGSDHFFSAGGAESVQKSLILSVQSGLPVTGAMLTRSSPWQAFLQHQLVTEPYRLPAVFKDYPSQKPLLLLFSHVLSPADEGKWDHLKSYSEPVLEGDSWTVYESPLTTFAKRIKQRVDSLRSEAKDRNVFYNNGFYASADSMAFIYRSLDEFSSEKSYRGGGAAELVGSGYQTVCVDSLPGGAGGMDYTLSLWVYVREPGQGTSTIFLKEYDQSGRELQQRTYGIGFQASVYDPKGWVLLECPFKSAGESSKIEVGLRWPKADENQKIWVDEVLLKLAGLDLSRETSGEFWWNNRHWKLEDALPRLND
ncbi:MAG: hypothetical protein CMN32_01725 [Saprospirales bacterium]|nr:hypothetical protein [Saprospirales bacterium]